MNYKNVSMVVMKDTVVGDLMFEKDFEHIWDNFGRVLDIVISDKL